MRFLPVLCFVLFSPFAHATDLKQAVDQALASHPGIKAARMSVEAGKLEVKGERSALYPTVNLTATGGRIYGDNATSRGLVTTRGAGYTWLWEGSATMRQTLYDWSATGARVDRADALMRSAQFGLMDTMDATAYRAVQAYIAVAAAREAMQLVTMQQQDLQDMQQRIAIAVRDGGGDEAELSRADDLILLADNTMANAIAREATADANYREAVGGNAPQNMRLPSMPSRGIPGNVNQAVADALKDHPQMAAAQARAVSYDKESDAEIAAALPRLEGQLSYLKRDQRDSIGGEAVDARATLNMNWDIETGGGALVRAERMRMLAAQASAEEEEVRLALERDIRTAWAGYDLAARQIEIQGNRVDSAQSVMNTYENQFEAAQRSLLDLMTAKNQLYEARLARLDAYYAQIDAAYTIIAAMGGLREYLQMVTKDNKTKGMNGGKS